MSHQFRGSSFQDLASVLRLYRTSGVTEIRGPTKIEEQPGDSHRKISPGLRGAHGLHLDIEFDYVTPHFAAPAGLFVVAQQHWPLAALSMAWSKSRSRKTGLGELPPGSSDTFFRFPAGGLDNQFSDVRRTGECYFVDIRMPGV